MIQIVLSNLLRNKRRAVLTLLGVVIGVAAIISLVSVSVGLTERSGVLLSSFEGIFVLEEGAVDIPFSKIPNDYINDLENVPGVKLVVPEIWGSAKNIGGDEYASFLASFLQVVGIDPGLSSGYAVAPYYEVVKGRTLTVNDRKSVIIGEGLADRFGLTIGSSLKINDETYQLVGLFSSDAQLMNFIVVTHIDTAREITEFEDGYVSNYQVIPINPEDMKSVKQRIESRFEGVLQTLSMQDSAELITGFLGSLNLALWFVSGIAGIVGGIGVMNTMLMSVMERIKEFGVLKAIGWRDRDVMIMVILESVIISIVGGIIGVILGFYVSGVVVEVSRIPSAITPALIGQAMFFAITMGFVGSIYPAYKSSKMSPIEAVRG
ncbi:MAG: ABC transporter permease [Nanoarchaeota archaeon]|nr:ABC transporter permease [Nanoarchaeota archaeon]